MWTYFSRSALLLLLCSCTPSDSGDAAKRAQAEGPIDFFVHPESGGEKGCPANVTANLQSTISVQIWSSASFESAKLTRQTRGLEDVFSQLGIKFQLLGDVRVFEEKALFVASGKTGADALAKATSNGQNLGPSQRAKVLGPYVAAPLRRLLSKLDPAGQRDVQIVFVDRIVGPRSTVAAGLRNVAGLTLSPFAPAEERSEIEALLGTSFNNLPAPIIFLSMYELSKMRPALRKSTLAHEMGHALGLGHVASHDNLMSQQRRASCMPGLGEEQVEVLRKVLTEH